MALSGSRWTLFHILQNKNLYWESIKHVNRLVNVFFYFFIYKATGILLNMMIK